MLNRGDASQRRLPDGGAEGISLAGDLGGVIDQDDRVAGGSQAVHLVSTDHHQRLLQEGVALEIGVEGRECLPELLLRGDVGVVGREWIPSPDGGVLLREQLHDRDALLQQPAGPQALRGESVASGRVTVRHADRWRFLAHFQGVAEGRVQL